MARISALISAPLLFLLFAFFTTKLNFAAARTVIDADGKGLQNGGDYYILPSYNEEGPGGGVTLASIGVTHPLVVVQSDSHNSLGLAVTLSGQTMLIQTDETVSIKFTNILEGAYNFSSSSSSSNWIVVKDEWAKLWYVGIGSASDYPADQVQVGSFQIKEYNLGYQLIFCGGSSASDCEDVGLYNDSYGNNRLALIHGAPYVVEFKNADRALVAYE